MLDVNLAGFLYCARAALPHLLRRPRTARAGRPIWSTSARWPAGSPVADSAVYNMTKHGVGAFSEALRQEVADRHVRVSVIEPGAVDTELAGHNRPEIREGTSSSASPASSGSRRPTSPTPSATW